MQRYSKYSALVTNDAHASHDTVVSAQQAFNSCQQRGSGKPHVDCVYNWKEVQQAGHFDWSVQGPGVELEERRHDGRSTSVVGRGLRYDSWRTAVQLTIVDATHCCGSATVSAR